MAGGLNLGGAFGSIDLDASPAIQALQSVGRALGGITAPSAAASTALAGIQATASTAASSANSAISGLSSTLSGLAGAPSRAVGGIVDGLGRIGLAAAGLQAVAGTVGGFVTGLTAGNRQFETFETQLKVMLGSVDAAKGRIAELSRFAAATPFELPEIVKAEKILEGFQLSGARAVQKTGQDLSGLRTILGNTAALTGATFEEIALNVGKFSAGATGEALQRFAELGIVTREQLTGMGIQFSKSGELVSPLEDALKAVITVMDQRFKGGMADLSNTLDGLLSTLADNWANFRRTLTQPLFEAIKPQVAQLNTLLSSDAVAQFAQQLAGGLGRAVAAMVGILPPAIDGILTLLGAMQGTWEPAPGIGQFASLAGQAGLVAASVRDGILSFVGAVRGDWEPAPGITRLPLILGTIGRAVGGLGAIGKALADIALGGARLDGLADATARLTAMFPILRPLEPLMLAIGRTLGQVADGFGAVANVARALIAVDLSGWGIDDLVRATGDLVDIFPGLAPFWPILEQVATAAGSGVAAIKGLADSVVGLVTGQPAVEGLRTTVESLATAAPGVAEAFGGLAASLGGAAGASGALGAALTGALTGVDAQFAAVGAAANLALAGDVPGAVTTMLASVVAGRLGLVEGLATWGAAFVEWVAPAVPGILEGIGAVVAALTDWAVAQVPVIAARLAAWAEAFAAWVEPIIDPLLAKLGTLAQRALAWIAEAAGPLLQQLISQWVPAFANWVLDAGTALVPKLGAFAVSILDWIAAEAPGFLERLISEWVPAFIGWVAQAIVEITPHLIRFMGTVADWVVNTGAPAAGRAALAIGEGLVRGIAKGIGNLQGWIQDQIAQLATGLLDAAKAKLGIKSPSTEAAKEIGQPFVEGIAAGLAAEAGRAEAAAGDVAGAMLARAVETMAGVLPEAMAAMETAAGSIVATLDDLVRQIAVPPEAARRAGTSLAEGIGLAAARSEDAMASDTADAIRSGLTAGALRGAAVAAGQVRAPMAVALADSLAAAVADATGALGRGAGLRLPEDRVGGMVGRSITEGLVGELATGLPAVEGALQTGLDRLASVAAGGAVRLSDPVAAALGESLSVATERGLAALERAGSIRLPEDRIGREVGQLLTDGLADSLARGLAGVGESFGRGLSTALDVGAAVLDGAGDRLTIPLPTLPTIPTGLWESLLPDADWLDQTTLNLHRLAAGAAAIASQSRDLPKLADVAAAAGTGGTIAAAGPPSSRQFTAKVEFTVLGQGLDGASQPAVTQIVDQLRDQLMGETLEAMAGAIRAAAGRA